MNVLELILLAALSSGIVAVSLRLRASASSAVMWPDRDRITEGEHQRARSAEKSPGWLRNPYSLKGERDSFTR